MSHEEGFPFTEILICECCFRTKRTCIASRIHLAERGLLFNDNFRHTPNTHDPIGHQPCFQPCTRMHDGYNCVSTGGAAIQQFSSVAVVCRSVGIALYHTDVRVISLLWRNLHAAVENLRDSVDTRVRIRLPTKQQLYIYIYM